MRSYAVFDIDGTIIRWQLYHALADALAKRGQLDQEAFDKVKAARMSWKKRADQDSFREYESELVSLFQGSLTQFDVSEFEEACSEVFEQYKDQVYTYTRDLIGELKAKNYLLFAISGSPDMIVSKLAKYYGFDDYRAAEYEIVAGKFTGQIELTLGKKPDKLVELIANNNASTKASIGVGDSEGDIAMLQIVDQPIAFNPSKQLLEQAKQNGWQIIVERKNAIYDLNKSDDTYILA